MFTNYLAFGLKIRVNRQKISPVKSNGTHNIKRFYIALFSSEKWFEWQGIFCLRE
jgi:hypothetical protein